MARRKNMQGDQPATRSAADAWQHPDVRAALEQHRQLARLDEQEHFDAFKNELTGIGDFTRDKTFGGFEGGLDFILSYLTGYMCETRWRGSDLGGRIVECVPDEMTRAGFEVVVQPEGANSTKLADKPADIEEEDDEEADEEEAKTDAFGAGVQQAIPPEHSPAEPDLDPLPDLSDDGLSDAVEQALVDLEVADRFWEALCYERAYGGGAILIGADDGARDLTKPLDVENVKSVDYLNTFTGGWDGECVAWSYYNDPRKANYGKPMIYCIRNIGVPVSQTPAPGQLRANARAQSAPDTLYWVHESRLLIFSSAVASRNARTQMRGWGDSIFTRIDRVLQQYDQTWGGVAVLMTEFSQGILEVTDLLARMGAGKQEGAKGSGRGSLASRAAALQMTRSISRTLLIDKEHEAYRRESAQLGGVAEVLQQFALRLAAAADMPVTLLMGQAPSGMNATGESDVRFFYDRVAAKQRKRMLPPLQRLVKLLFCAKEGPTQGKEPKRWKIDFNSLYQRTEQEEANLRKTVAETDAINITQRIYSAAEAAASAYSGAGWTMERTLDFEGRKKAAAEKKKKAEELEKQALEAPKPPDPTEKPTIPVANGAIQPKKPIPDTEPPVPGPKTDDAPVYNNPETEAALEGDEEDDEGDDEENGDAPAAMLDLSSDQDEDWLRTLRKTRKKEETAPLEPAPALAPAEKADDLAKLERIVALAKDARLAGYEIDISEKLAEHGITVTGKVD